MNEDKSDGGGEGKDWLVLIQLRYGNKDPEDDIKHFELKVLI